MRILQAVAALTVVAICVTPAFATGPGMGDDNPGPIGGASPPMGNGDGGPVGDQADSLMALWGWLAGIFTDPPDGTGMGDGNPGPIGGSSSPPMENGDGGPVG